MKNTEFELIEQLHERCNLLARQHSFLPLAQELIQSLNIFMDINYLAVLIRNDDHIVRKSLEKNHIIIGHNTVFHNTIWKIIQNGIIDAFSESSISEEDVLKDFLDVTLDVVNLGKNKPVTHNPEDNHILHALPLAIHDTPIGVLVLIDNKERLLTDYEQRIIDFFIKQFLINFENRMLSTGLKEIAVNDQLTDTFNKKHFLDRFKKEFSRAKRFYTPLTMLIAEVKNLKQINDQFGRKCGDRVMVHVADIFKETIRSIDLIGRNKEAEFIMLLPHTKPDGAVTLIKRIKQQLQNGSINIAGNKIPVEMSYGISSFPDNSALDPDEFLRSTEEALNHTRSLGAESFYVFSRDSISSIS